MVTRAAPVENVGDLPGKKVFDQLGREIGPVCGIYNQGDDPMWVTVESSTGLASDRLVFIPLARLKEEEGQLRVPYSVQHIYESPEGRSIRRALRPGRLRATRVLQRQHRRRRTHNPERRLVT